MTSKEQWMLGDYPILLKSELKVGHTLFHSNLSLSILKSATSDILLRQNTLGCLPWVNISWQQMKDRFSTKS